MSLIYFNKFIIKIISIRDVLLIKRIIKTLFLELVIQKVLYENKNNGNNNKKNKN
jgi:hypothetical protein